jgi:anaerobic selenocysteine-containing dehydrogenase
MIETKKTFCRFCHVFCGLEVDIDVDETSRDGRGRVVAVRGDRENEVTKGYSCQKGRAEVERIHHPDRLMSPEKREGDRWSQLSTTEALDEVAERLSEIVDRYGPNSVAVYTGCGGHRTSAGGPWFVQRWLDALGSNRMYTSYTIDSPSLTIAGNRLFGGPIPVNLLDVDRADCVMFVGTNPAASHQLNMPQSSPSARLNAGRKRGMKMIVVDPRRSDVARNADIHLQVKPGEDATLLAAMIKVVLDRGLQAHEYVDEYVSGVSELHEAVGHFDLDYASHRTGVAGESIEAAAEMFATAASGAATSGTGLHMAAHQNLATQLVMTLNAICGRFDRPGGMNRNEGALGRQFDGDMEAIRLPPPPKTRIRGISAINGLFGSYFEMPTNTLADEILTPGEGQIKALIVNGGNPALVLAEEASASKALEELDLLVVLDLFRSATAAHADYAFGVRHPFERVDVSKLMDSNYPFPFGQYTPALVDGPAETIEEWAFFWELAMRLGIPLRIGSLTAETRPTTDELLDVMNRHARLPLDELRKYPSGVAFAERHTAAGGVIPNMIGHPDKKMAAGHPDLLAELRAVRGEPVVSGGGYARDEDYGFRMITYRMKEVYCSQGQNLPSLASKRPYNPVWMNPIAMDDLGLVDGDPVWVENQNGQVEGFVESSKDVAPETIAFAFGWGDPNDPRSAREKGSNVQRLISDDSDFDSVTGLARQSAIPVNVRPSDSGH